MPKPTRVDRRIILSKIEALIAPDSPPVLLRAVTINALQSAYMMDSSLAAEHAERLFSELKREIESKALSAANDYFGYFYHIIINSINDEYVQGACHIQNKDTVEVKNAKNNRKRFARIAHFVDLLTPVEFEKFCGKIISLIGVEDSVVSRSSGDQGIDFFGRWHLKSLSGKGGFPPRCRTAISCLDCWTG